VRPTFAGSFTELLWRTASSCLSERRLVSPDGIDPARPSPEGRRPHGSFFRASQFEGEVPENW
jgi:hypothetical protein